MGNWMHRFWQGRPVWFDGFKGVRAGKILHYHEIEDRLHVEADGQVEAIFGSQVQFHEADAWQARAERCAREAAEQIANCSEALQQAASCRTLSSAGAAPSIPTEPAHA